RPRPGPRAARPPNPTGRAPLPVEPNERRPHHACTQARGPHRPHDPAGYPPPPGEAHHRRRLGNEQPRRAPPTDRGPGAPPVEPAPTAPDPTRRPRQPLSPDPSRRYPVRSSMPSTGSASRGTHALIATTLRRLSRTPSRIMSRIATMPLPKTIAFGGVATGSMNARLAATATGMARASGWRPRPGATAATIGTSAAAVAVLLVISVRNTTTRV